MAHYSPFYKVEYLNSEDERVEDEEIKDSSKTVSQSFNKKGALWDTPTLREDVSDETKKDDIPLIQVIPSRKEMNEQQKPLLDELRSNLKRLLYTKRRYERKSKRLEKENREEKWDRQEVGLELMDKIDKTQEEIHKNNEKIYKLEKANHEQQAMIAGRDIDMLRFQNKFQDYKENFITKTRASRNKICEIVTDLLREEYAIEVKLQQKWRLFGKSKLRKELREVEHLRKRLDLDVGFKLQEEVQYLKLGYFKLSYEVKQVPLIPVM